ncbi:MAG: metallophosphoesterase family protein [Desulfobacteraceae bacterium]|nr:metallophosphoesterase family protein [Desulfobacteraceae bacterium]
MPRTFVIADIHGCHQALARLLEKISPDPDRDTLVFLGDYVDRGPASREVVETLLDLRRSHARLVTLMGNHESMLLDYLAGGDPGLFLAAGGAETLESYGIVTYGDQWTQEVLPPEHRRFLEGLLPWWEDENFIYVHAGLEPGVELACQSKDWLLWARQGFIDSDFDFGKRVIYGHTPWPEPRVDATRIGIDTGAVYGGRLTCLVLPEMEFVSVEGGVHGAGWRD